MTDEHSVWIATLNLWGERPPVVDRMAIAAEALRSYSCGIVLAQEVSQDNLGALADRLGAKAVRLVAGEPGFALGALSATGFDEVRETALPSPAGQSRALLSARVTGRNLWVHSTHLSFGMDQGLWRERQVVALARAVAEIDAADGAEPVHVLGGDFNADPDADEMRFLRGLTTLEGMRCYFQDAWLRCHPVETGETWSMETGSERAARSVDFDRRLDYLWVSARRKSGQGTVLDCVRFVREASEGVLASDHCGLLARVWLG